MTNHIICFIALVITLVTSCSHRKPNTHSIETSKQLNESLVKANKLYVKNESNDIDQYIKRHNWKMNTTGTGLRYFIYKNGNGMLATSGKTARVNFKISLLDGTLCYSSEKLGAKEFLIDRDNIESGIHEGVKYLHVGDKAFFILPSHLAHGLIGDENKIPPRSSVVYEIELLSIN